MIIALLVFAVALLLVLGILGLMRSLSLHKRRGVFYRVRKKREKFPTESLHEILFHRSRGDTDRLEV